MTEYATAWLAAFVVTLLAEVPVYAALSPGTRTRGALVGAGASILTHPALWFVVVPNIPWHGGTWLVAEATITVVEGVWWWAWWRGRVALPRAVGVALAANLTSITVGALLSPFVPWF